MSRFNSMTRLRPATAANSGALRCALLCSCLVGCTAFHATPAPPRVICLRAGQATWEERYRELGTYRSTWGTADAPLGDARGRWCRTQRQQYEEGRLSEDRVAQLDSLKFSWQNPTELSPEELEAIWDQNVDLLRAYIREHGDGQVPKKYKLNPTFGGWVAAVRRRGPDGLAPDRRAALASSGFEWKSTRKCGSAFMTNFRALQDLPENEAPAPELVAWIAAQRKLAAKGGLSAERCDYLASIGAL